MTDVTGTWMLVRAIAFDTDGNRIRDPYGAENVIGRLVLTKDGRMAATLGDARKSVPAGQVREYSAYSGNYAFDGKRLVTRVDCASDPARMGSDQVRDVRFDGDLMVLRPPPTKYLDIVEQRELYWRRISAE